MKKSQRVHPGNVLIILLTLFVCVSSVDAQVSRAQIDELVAAKVDTALIVGLIQKECVSFKVDAQALLEMRKYPSEILAAAIGCQTSAPRAKDSEGPATLTIRVNRQGDGSSDGTWGIFVPWATRVTNGWADSKSGADPDADADLGVLFTTESGEPLDVVRKLESGEPTIAQFLTSCKRDTATTRTSELLLPTWVRIYGCYWSPAQNEIRFEVPAGEHTVRAVTLLRMRGSIRGSDWVHIDPLYRDDMRIFCPQFAYDAETKVKLAPGQARDLTYTISTTNVKLGKQPGVCTEMSLR